MKQIITELDQLREPAEPLKFMTDAGIEKEEGLAIIADLKEVLEANPTMTALSAPQIGIKSRILCIRFSDGIKTFIDPIVTKKSGFNIMLETCASMPGKEIVIGRPTELVIKYYNEEFKYEDNKLLGAVAGIFDQQTQILDGVVPSDCGLVSDIERDGHVTDEDLPLVAEFYRTEFIPAALAALQRQIEADPDEKTANNYKQLKFTEDVVNGRIQVIESEAELNARNEATKAANASIRQAVKSESLAKKAAFKAGVTNILRKKR